MTKIFSLAFIFVAIALCACNHHDATPVSPVPVIEFDRISYMKSPFDGTISITLNFQDGDGDMGFSVFDNLSIPPFNPIFLFKKSTGEPVPDIAVFNGSVPVDSLIQYHDRKVIDTLPAFDAPEACKHWMPNTFQNRFFLDTIYFRINPYSYNALIEMYVDGVLYDRSGDWCDWANLSTRMMYDNHCLAEGDLRRCTWLSNRSNGTANIAMNLQWSTRFSGKKLKFSIYVFDAMGHKSNVVMTDEVLISP